MRDRRFVAEHRGGPLTKDQQRHLIIWAASCARHVFPLYRGEPDQRLTNALKVAEEWAKGNSTVGDARKASLDSIAVANEVSDSISVAIARAVGHAVATAHMADHSLGGAIYALKAVQIAGKSVENEKKWQNAQLPESIKNLILTSRVVKEKYFKL